MADPIDQIKDSPDSSDQCNTELHNEATSTMCQPKGINEITSYWSKVNGDKPSLHHIDAPSDSPTESSHDKVQRLLENKVDQLRTTESSFARKSGVEQVVDLGLVKHPDLKTEEAQRAFTEKIQQRLAIELEAIALNSGGDDPIASAIDDLRSKAGDNLPEDFEEKVVDWLEDQKRCRIANEEAELLGLKDDEGNPLRFPCAESDEDLADALYAFANGYEKFEKGELTGEAARAYNNNPEGFIRDWRSSVAMCLNPIGEDDQAQMGSCAMNTQLVAAWTKSPREMSEAQNDCMTQGYAEVYGGTVELSANELGRTRSETNGQPQSVFIGNSMLASAAYGQMHYNGNVVETMDEASTFITGYSVSSTPGAYHKLIPGHSMGALNKVAANGRAYRYQYNHWNQFGANEPGDGEDYYFGQLDLSKVG